MDRDQETTVAAEQTSQAFVGEWNQLISTTNWEKGRIIHEWRAALMKSGAALTEYSDETWSRMVGGVTGQHTGRLRRVYERFGDVQTQYEGLYWSHFQAALDWDDAEMWLEGAVQNRWSVSALRRQRWETLGAIPADEPQDTEQVTVDLDEDFEASAEAGDREERELVAEHYTAEARSPAGPDFGDEDEIAAGRAEAQDVDWEPSTGSHEATATTVRPFADLPELPEDLTSAFEAYQLAILRHKREQWAEVSLDDVLASLDALKALALAPAE